MMAKSDRRWVDFLTGLALRHSRWMLVGVGIVTLISLVLVEHLVIRMNWTDLLPESNQPAMRYREIGERFGEASIAVVLEGDRDSIVKMAEELEPRLAGMEELRNVFGKMPTEFIRDHGFALVRPEQFDRMLDMFTDWSLTGAIRGINDDYESEYTSSEANMSRDEIDIARSMLGITRSLELISRSLSGEGTPEMMAEAADAFSVGEPWMLSLDRQMLIITCTPVVSFNEIDLIIATVAEVEETMYEVSVRHPDVHASLTGIAKISQDEMHSVGIYTQLLSLVALILIYLLLAKSFSGKGLPLLALAPLMVGIFWALGALKIIYGSLNIMTAMMMLVLIGLGIDFSIHLVTRYREEMGLGSGMEKALKVMLGGSGVGVITGATTTALAFLTLMVGDTRGVHEFGVAAGLGVILTLVAVFLMLPSLLVIRERRLARKIESGSKPESEKELSGTTEPPVLVGPASDGYQWIGRIAAFGYRHPGLSLALVILILATSGWASRHTAFEYDFLELEAKGLRSVELQREIPERFGMSEHAAWLITDSIEESRALKEEFRNLPQVGGVDAISDYLVSAEQLADYTPKLIAFRDRTLNREIPAWRSGDGAVLAIEIDRLWDNLDLMSNLAFTAGLDRIVKVIDHVTGVDSETGETDQSALLPTISSQLDAGVSDLLARPFAEAWAERLHENLVQMSNPASIDIGELPENIKRAYIPHTGEGYLLNIIPRDYLFEKSSMERFSEQTEAVDADVISTEKLFLVMMEETLADGRKAALLALIVIALLLIIHFRGPLGLLAMTPLVVGATSMLGLMYVLGMEYNYINLIAVPIILGIGIDDGVHALHRFHEERGEGVERVSRSFRMVGKAILLTSVTTMIGFGSVGIYEMRGMASFGQVLAMGVGTCFLATIFVLPPLLRIFYPGRRKNA
ncbi:RND family transporter [Gemmatimonadota bacterium]